MHGAGGPGRRRLTLAENSLKSQISIKKKGTSYFPTSAYYLYNYLIIRYIDIYNIYGKRNGGTLKNN
jgi:hypothetical protein